MRIFKIMAVLSFFGGLSADSMMNPIDSEYLRQLNHIRSHSSIAELNTEYQSLRTLQVACRLEIEERKVPLSCYKASEIEEKWHLLSSNQIKERFNQLDHLCSEACKALRLPHTSAKLDSISKACQDEIERARKIEIYRSQENQSLERILK